MQKLIKIGTRKSQLALAQSNGIKDLIEAKYPGVTVELVKIMTKGDKILDVPLAKVGGKGLFVKELEEAMLNREVDMAVHSMKDVPAELPDELHLALITKREDPKDAFISNKYQKLTDLPQGAKVGTSSLRRRAQIAKIRPDLIIEDLRGNLDTRLRKLDEGQFDAIILAAAGLNRLKLDRATAYFDTLEMLPAVGQGAVGIEMRRDAAELLEGLKFLNDWPTEVTVRAERAFLLRLEGGCQVPIAGHCTIDNNNQLTLTGLVASVDGKEVVKKTATGPADQPETLGRNLAEEILATGGRAILEEVYGTKIA